MLLIKKLSLTMTFVAAIAMVTPATSTVTVKEVATPVQQTIDNSPNAQVCFWPFKCDDFKI